MNRPSLSIIIATYNREAVLCETIESVLTHTCKDVQVVVVDQTARHDESTSRFLMEAAKHRRFVHRVESIANLPRARNVGIALSSGMVLLFLDDDVLIHRDFVESHLRHYRDERLAGVTGRIVFPGENPDAAPPLPIDPREAMNRLDLQIMRYQTPVRNPLHFVGANMSFRRCWLESVGGFSHRFGGSALGEELELAGRLRRAGGRTIYDPRAWLIHRVEQTGGCRSEAPPYPRQRDRMRNYYYALYHGLGPLEASRQAISRWTKRFQPAPGNPREGRSASSKQVPGAAGRIVGAVQGISKSILFYKEQGNLTSLRIAKSAFHEPTMSIVVPTYNRSVEILDVLRCIASYAPRMTEVVIVDQSDAESPELETLREELSESLDIRYHRQSIPNASRARNVGVAHCRGEVILFIDDDTTFDSDLIQQHLAAHRRCHRAIVGGRIVWPDEDPSKPKPLQISPKSARDQIEAPVCYHTTRLSQPLHIITCNMSIRRDWFVRAGGFNERLTGGGEDLELVARVRRLGGRILYEPRAWLYHHNSPMGGIRLSLKKPFRHGFLRGRANHYATIRAVGLLGWVVTCARRLAGMTRRAVGNRHVYGGVKGPVAQLRSSRSKGFLSRWGTILCFKGAQCFGSFAAVPFSLTWCLMDRSRGGDYRSSVKGPRR